MGALEFLGGVILGFIVGGVVFTEAGREAASATGRRVGREALAAQRKYLQLLEG